MTDREKITLALIELYKMSEQIDRIINNSSLEKLFWNATGYNGIDYSGDKIQTTPTNTMEKALCAMADLETKLHISISSIKRIVDIINKCDDVNKDILLLRYYYRKDGRRYTIRDIAGLCSTTESHIKYQHRLACIQFFEICQQNL